MREARIQDAVVNYSKTHFSPAVTTAVSDFLETDKVESWRADPSVLLMERARGGDIAAFETLFRKHHRVIVQHAYNLLHSRERAEEVTQMVFLQLYRARERYEPRARFLTFLYRITTNACLNELRRREYSTEIESLDAPPENQDRAMRAPIADGISPDPAEHVAGVELATEFQAALKRLPHNQRAAFLLGRIDGLPYSEVAESLDLSVSAVKSLIFRATSTMRDELRAFL